MPDSAIKVLLLLISVLPWLTSCAGLRGFPGQDRSFVMSDVLSSGDPARRASMQLVIEGLDADAEALPERGLDRYRRALQVDPGNPYAYLAMARHEMDELDPEQALSYLEKASALLNLEVDASPGVEAHLVGLRGAALRESGRSAEGSELLERARRLAPQVWSDGRLDADELR